MSKEVRKRIHFGALDSEIQDNERDSESFRLGIQKGNVNISTVESETLDLSYASIEDQEKHAKALRQFEEKRKSKNIIVPTDDSKVKEELRNLGQPICLFGEGPGDRRNRLRLVLARVNLDSYDYRHKELSEAAAESQRQKKTIYTTATKELIQARMQFATFSWEKSKHRLQRLKRLKLDRDLAVRNERSISDTYSQLKKFSVQASQFGDTRPLSCCKFSNDVSGPGAFLATGSFSSVISVWSNLTYERLYTLIGHEERVVDVAFQPSRGASDQRTLCSGSADMTALLWKVPTTSENISLSELKPVGVLKGHAQRLSKLAWHPMGDHIVTSSYDTTWRLWDVNTHQEILLQDGHESAVYGIAFHPDGSLFASADLNGVGRVWDLRSGKSIFALTGHAMQVLSVDFSQNGYHLATGSGDHSARVYDLRQQKVLAIIPGHQSIVSKVQFAPESGAFLVTAGYDNVMNVWSSRDFSLLKRLTGHESKIMDFHISITDQELLSCSYDKTWKIWAAK